MDEAEYLPISGLQHLAFCERQCALIHVERIWVENVRTAQGRIIHERTDMPGVSDHGRVLRALELCSTRLRLVGRADVVELVDNHDTGAPSSIPVEYKRGRTSSRWADRIQLCAQAMALEEMFGATVTEGAILYASSQKRVTVPIDDALRRDTTEQAVRFHELVKRREIPPADWAPKCQHCSLQEPCQPRRTEHNDPERYLHALFRELTEGLD